MLRPYYRSATTGTPSAPAFATKGQSGAVCDPPEPEYGRCRPTPMGLGEASGGTRSGCGIWVVVVLVTLVFSATFGIGAQIDSAMSTDHPSRSRRLVPEAVSPSALPTRKPLLPAIAKPGEVPLRTGLPPYYVVGKGGLEGGSAFEGLGLPFGVRETGPGWRVFDYGESTYGIYRGLRAGDPPGVAVEVSLAAHPCRDLAGCLAERAEFDTHWTTRCKAGKPSVRRDAGTWYAETKSPGGGYSLSMTRIFRSPTTNQWWLVGVTAHTEKAEWTSFLQAVVNDIRTQTS